MINKARQAVSALEMSAVKDIPVEKAEELRKVVYQVLDQAEKNNKALATIQEKQVNVSALLELNNLQQYNDYCVVTGGCKKLTQEEWNLLKEELK